MLIASSGSTVGVVVVLVVVVFLVLLLLSRSVRVIQQGTVGAVKRLGKYRPPVRQSGWTTVIPFLDTIQKVDVREEPRVGDMQQVITKDNVSVLVNATIYSQVIDVELALFEVSNYHVAVDQLARTALRAVFGGMTLDEALSERQRINAELQTHMASATEKWGVRLNRIEIVDIVPPQNILNAMALQKEADQQKRAAILQSEGLQQAAINTAQGEKQASILRAEGDKQSAILRAEGDKEAAVRLGEGRAGCDPGHLHGHSRRQRHPRASRGAAARDPRQSCRERQCQAGRSVRDRGDTGRRAGTALGARRCARSRRRSEVQWRPTSATAGTAGLTEGRSHGRRCHSALLRPSAHLRTNERPRGQPRSPWRTITTGQWAPWTQCWLTEPSSMPAKAPWPLLPRTNRSALADSLTRTSEA